jgi:hypothetical protein
MRKNHPSSYLKWYQPLSVPLSYIISESFFMATIELFDAAMSSIAKIWKTIKEGAAYVGDNSITKVAKITRCEPLAILSHDCHNVKQLPEIMDALVNVYAGYYLQAANMLLNVNDVEIIRTLDKLNPNRDDTAFLLLAAEESFTSPVLRLEHLEYALPNKETYKLFTEAADASKPRKHGLDQTDAKILYETANLAVGKMISLRASAGADDCENGVAQGTIIEIPVSVRLSPSFVPDETLNYLFTHKALNSGIMDRYHGWRSGRLRFIQDAIFCQDLINEYRKAVVKDKSGIIAEINRRVTNARAFGVATKNPSLAIASNIYVITSETEKRIEALTGLKFNNAKGREKLLEGSYCMVIAVIDQNWEQVKFYYNGIANPSVIKFTMLKKSGKDGPDIGDIMKSLLQGNAPTF